MVKAAGRGLSGRPRPIDVPPGRRQGRWRDYRWMDHTAMASAVVWLRTKDSEPMLHRRRQHVLRP
ncbi:hypothetical protein ACWDFR_21715 [Streptomyces sp. 900105755]|uniref:hypothetical protein n=1 Tax=Streptomyces sp. NPDC001507 TaxID=3364579 RepID=UPI00368825EF